MRIKISILAFSVALLLPSCKLQDGNEVVSSGTIPLYTSVAEVPEVTFDTQLTTINFTTTTNEDILLAPVEASEEKFLKIFGDYGMGDGERSSLEWTIYGMQVEFTWIASEEEFISLISDEDYQEWYDKYFEKRIDFEKKNNIYYQIGETLPKYPIDFINIRLNEFSAYENDISDDANIYTFICDFNLSENEARDVIAKVMLNPDRYGVSYRFTDEQIDAICKRDKAKITELFAQNQTIVKGEKYYPWGWFFYASVDEYKQAGITLDDLLSLNVKSSYDNNGFKTSYVFPYTHDRMQSNFYEFAESKVDVIELCGYDRDFDMPLPFSEYYANKNNEYFAFYGKIYTFDNYIDKYMLKDKSLSWVYYNKPAAYREAGITHAELSGMLPKYRKLGILSEVALAALEGKIDKYVAENINARFSERIGSTVYRVSVFFPAEEKESLETKILRLIKNDLIFESKCGIMDTLQTGRLPNGGSL
ncbi:hypothetical protein FACS189499_08500 [Clostridia bacterium]|nr:hypothetical protein FACS189499_08500 [Clostridia bacterium]